MDSVLFGWLPCGAMEQRLVKNVHVFVRRKNGLVSEKAQELVLLLEKKGLRATLIAEGEGGIGDSVPDLAFVVGGDGTFLAACHLYAPLRVPLLGVDMGGLGFLAEVSVEEMEQATDQIVSGAFTLEERMMAHCRVVHEDGKEEEDFALNDVVIYRGPFAQMIRLSTYIDGEFLASFPADGLIVATPTGSSAYSLSAGGPVVFPGLELFIVTPICAHTLYARSIVLPSSSCIQVVLESLKEGTMVTLDGQRGYALRKGERIMVHRSPFSAVLVRLLPERPFYALLRNKLSWGMDIRKRVEQEC